MANNTSNISGVGAVAVRATRLLADGTPVSAGDDDEDIAGYSTCKFTEITMTPVVVAGTDIQQQNAGGFLCINVSQDDQITGYDVELEQCDLDAEFREIIGATAGLIVDGEGDTIGAELPGGVQSCGCAGSEDGGHDIALEFWVQAYECNEKNGYYRYVIPSIRFSPSAQATSFGNAAVLARFAGTARPNQNIGATGPWDDTPTGVSLSGNSPVYFWESTLPAGLDATAGTYISAAASS